MKGIHLCLCSDGWVLCFRRNRNKNGPNGGIPAAATSHPLLSGPNSDPVEVQSIYLSDCRPYHQADHICPLDICPQKSNNSWDPSFRDPSSNHFHNAALFASIPAGTTPPRSRSASPASFWRSPGNELPEFTARGSMATAAAATDRTMTSSFLALLSETPKRARPRSSVGSAEARFSDPGLPPYGELNCGTESGTFDLLNDFARRAETTTTQDQLLKQQLDRHPSAHGQQPPVSQTYEGHSDDCVCSLRAQTRFEPFSGGHLTRGRMTTSTTPAGNAKAAPPVT